MPRSGKPRRNPEAASVDQDLSLGRFDARAANHQAGHSETVTWWHASNSWRPRTSRRPEGVQSDELRPSRDGETDVRQQEAGEEGLGPG
jgi:hypothetical protein